jgi:ribosomal protein S18 acetylase RimI-like enzyme
MAITYRPGTLADSHAVFTVFEGALADLSGRLGVQADMTAGEPEAWWLRRPLFEHLARTAAQFWVAEVDGDVIGYARSIERDGVLELTEFFVRPGHQSGGIGGELLARAFPAEGARHRVIVATTDSRALGRYLRAGVYPRFPIYFLGRAPSDVTIATDLTVMPITNTSEALPVLARIDQAVLGHRREADHIWLLDVAQGYVYMRRDEPVGYGYIGRNFGPFALLDAADFPAVLAQVEALAQARGAARVGFEVPLVNKAAVDFLIGRGYRLDGFFAFFMSDSAFGRFENYICTSPPFFI